MKKEKKLKKELLEPACCVVVRRGCSTKGVTVRERSVTE
jgi:hypothetical protein